MTLIEKGIDWLTTNEFVEFLVKIAIKAEIKSRKDEQLMDSMQIVEFQTHLYKNFGNLTISEIYKSVSDNVITLATKRVQSYGSLSMSFIFDCIQNYLEKKELYKKTIINAELEAIKKSKQLEFEEKQKQLIDNWDKNRNEIIKDFIIDDIKKLNAGTKLIAPALSYDMLEKNNLLNPTNEEKNNSIITAKSNMNYLKNYSQDKSIREKMKNALIENNNSIIITEAKSILYHQYLLNYGKE